jgi:hypothetical protein
MMSKKLLIRVGSREERREVLALAGILGWKSLK